MDEADPTPPPEALNKLLELAMPELLAFKPSSKQTRRIVSRERVTELTEVLVSSWVPMKHQIDELFAAPKAEQHKAELGRVDNRAWVFYAADLAAEELHADVTKKAEAELALKVKEHDRHLMTWAAAVFSRDPEHAATLQDIARGSGKRDDAEDVMRLVKLFDDNWALAEQKQNEITKADLDKAATDASLLLHYLRNRKKNPARKLADAAYALWYQDYDELMSLGRYLTRKDPDSSLRFPGVQEERSGPSQSVAPEEEDYDEDDDEEEEGEDEEEANDEDAGDGEGVPKVEDNE